jgi:hypothetical protein
LSNSAFNYNGKDYTLYPYGYYFDSITDNAATFQMEPWWLPNLENIDCGLYTLGPSGVTIWYQHGQKAALDALLTPVGAVCDAYAEDLFIYTGGAYVYQGDPLGWSVVSGYINPPTLPLANVTDYAMSKSQFTFNGVDYTKTNLYPQYTTYYVVWPITGLSNIDCGLYTISGKGGTKRTVWYEHGQKADVDAVYTILGAICDDYAEDVFTVAGGVFTYTGTPAGWTIYAGPNPPTLTLRVGTARVFPDAALDKAARDEIGIPYGNILQSDLDLVTSFTADTLGIVDLTGMEYWTTLDHLVLSDNSIVDISALSTLTDLTQLVLSDNSIVDISALSTLTDLTYLDLRNNSIVDISDLPTSNLLALYLLNNSIAAGISFATQANLANLDMSNNAIILDTDINQILADLVT